VSRRQSSRISLTGCPSAQRDYEAAFHHFKPDKRLRWLQHVGTATVKLELADRVVEVEATPIQAAIAELFEDRSTWTSINLGERLGVPDQAEIMNALNFWVTLGVLKERAGKGEWDLLELADTRTDRGDTTPRV